jgi:hypothetical protein
MAGLAFVNNDYLEAFAAEFRRSRAVFFLLQRRLSQTTDPTGRDSAGDGVESV